MEAIIISGMASSGKSTLAKMLAEHYNIEYVCGGDMLKEIAKREGYNPTENWWETEEGVEFLKKRQNNEEFDKLLDKLLIERAEKGNCVITSWALPWIWGKGIKIWLKASPEVRAKRMAKRDDMPFEEALKYIKTRDEENRKLYKKLYGYTLDKDLDVFDLVINTDDLKPEAIKDIVVKFIDEHVKAKA